ncbi:hypothetical protein Aph01nite_74690 [Acrocarpospora phusangensis]|uniref:DUF389 domain-containing protein n=1 Tax=Acrocarpospora phusangensis TaxID=1070424 RepID=A0A919QHH0_9ACTN|nr:DUF389 domain-containing protein [Acrocarpospora phusangensis]GIH29159.1 hypothetical protein Aph01nite_74690 [Acrocarpospora phusangensis]
MLHLRVISPPEHTEAAVALLRQAPGLTNLVVLPGVAHEPAGDLVQFDLAREAANEVIGHLTELGISAAGSIAVENVDLMLSDSADRAEEEAPGEAEDAVVWEELAQRVADDTRITWAFLAFLAIATQLAGIGVVVGSPILIVGAMVLGPEFGAIAAICFGLLRRHPDLIARAARALAVGFGVAIAITFACALVSSWLGWLDASLLDTHQEVEFIVKPDKWSFIVALLAGAAGVLSITAGKSSALVGVFISVTTVPAAGYAAVALALGAWEDVGGSALQLGVNLLGMVVSGTLTLYAQRLLWSRYSRAIPLTRRGVGRREEARPFG